MHRQATRCQRGFAALTAFACCAAQVTLPPQAEAAPGSSTASAGSAAPPAVQAIQSFQPDLFTGRATTSVPIAVPPGRKGLQPALALAYSSSARNGWVGVGWSLDAGYIERATKNGVPKYDATDTFAFMFQGVTSDLVQIPDRTYRAKDEGLFLRFQNNGVSGWEVRDKSGTRYLFGQTAASQVESLGKTFRWCLDKVIDINGNTITFTYAKDQNQLYLSWIDYTGHEPTALAPTNQVRFILDAAQRPDVDVNYRSGFAVTTAKRLASIETYATTADGPSLARRYNLIYRLSQRTGRSLLASVTQVGIDGATALPSTTFTYQEADAPAYTVSQNNPTTSIAAWNLSKAGADRSGSNYGCVGPYDGLPWQSPVVADPSHPADLGCYSATVGSDGNLTVSGCRDHYMHAWTWVYVGNARPVSLSYTGGEACMYLEDGNGLRPVGSSFTLQAGWSMIHLTGYDETSGWTNTLTGAPKNQVDLMSANQFIKPQLAGDANGDAITDLITLSATNATDGMWTVTPGQTSASSPGTMWLTNFGGTSSTPLLGDWDGDTRTDIAVFNSGSWQFALSTGSTFQVAGYASPSLSTGTPFTGDFNGDGRLDVGVFNNGSWQVAINTGSGFAPTGSFTLSWGSSNSEPLTGDFNGDGLTDIAIVDKTTGNMSVAPSNGSAFIPLATNWINSFGPTQPHLTADLNGDGLTDIGYYDKSTGQVRYAASTGTAFGASTTLPVTFTRRGTDDNPQVGDFNGDGLPDPAVFNAINDASELASSRGSFPDLLAGISNGLGGSTALQYQLSSSLPFVIPVVSKVTVSDGMGHSYFTTYVYKQGRYDAPSKEFRGFAQVEARDADANVSLTEFLQDDVMRGRPLRTQVQDTMGNLWSKQEQTWSVVNPQPGVNFVRLDQTDGYVYDGDLTYRQVRSRFAYDAYGNITTASEDGEPAVTGDERSTTTTYTLDTTDWILNKPSAVQTLDAAGAVIAQRRFTYDDVKANLTKEEEWLKGSPDRWLATGLTYDVYGNVATVTDAALHTTTNTYDATGTYLIQIKNHLNQTRQLAYDVRFGQVTSSTDQNGVTSTTEYDALGRVAKVIGPNDISDLPTIAYAYDLSSTSPSRTTVTTRVVSGQAKTLTVYSFMDGLGRTIQTRAPAEDPAKQVVSGAVELNNRGLAITQWVPYLDDASTAYVAPPATLATPVRYAYDPVGRLVTTTDPDGTQTLVTYNDGETTTRVADHETRKLMDAYGRLVRVEEVASPTDTYTTAYQYDTLGNLVNVTDHAGHITQMAYDSLGRKTSMDDPDMHHWTYAYDDVDNLTGQTDARGVATTFTYDALNRLTQKSYTIPQGSTVTSPGTVTYTYDTPNGTELYTKGKLTKVVDGASTSTFQYDNLGRLITETKRIDGTPYTVNRTYDLLGRLLALTYPDGDRADYTYNDQGGIETIDLIPATGPLSHLVTAIDYNAAGQLTKIVYGNGTMTDYSYDPQTLRLNHLITQSPNHTTLQDFSYSFDSLGNVTGIVDQVHTASQTFMYDAIGRLTQATGAYGVKTYAYSPIGNMLEKDGITMTYGENGAGPHAVTSTQPLGYSATGPLQMTYDANGNMLTKAPQDPLLNYLASTYAYDADNRLVQVDSPQQDTVTVTFKPGWNFFSLPVIPDDGAVVVLLPSFAQDFEQIAKFVPASATEPLGHFAHYVGNPAFDDFSALEYGVGYQVYCKAAADVTVTFSGKLPSKQLSKPLATGWHLLPALSLQPRALSQVLGGLAYDQVLDLNLQPVTQVKPGESYYVHLTAPGIFSPSLPRSPTTSFVYDGDGGKVKQITSAGTTTFVGELLEKTSTNTTKYVFAGSQRLAAFTTNYEPRTTNLSFYHTDHLGSTDLVTDAAGAVVEHTEHLPYGAVSRHDVATGPPGHSATAFGFTGQRQDTANTGLILFPARAYDPELGRFIQPDTIVQSPSDPQTLNRYSYVRNNPINLVDPSGYGWIKWLARIVGAVVGAVVGFFIAGPEGAVGGAIWGYTIGDSIGAAIERRQDSAASPSAPPAPPVSQIAPAPPLVSGGLSALNTAPVLSLLASATEEVGLDVSAALEDDLGLSPSVAEHIAPALETAAPPTIWADVILFGVGILGTVTGPDLTEAATLPALGKGATGLARRGLIKIRHFTNKVGRKAITKSGHLKEGTFVTTPRQVPRGLGRRNVEKLLELPGRGRGKNFIDLTVKKSDLKVPPNGPRTSGGKWQRILKKDVPVDPGKFQTYGQ